MVYDLPVISVKTSRSRGGHLPEPGVGGASESRIVLGSAGFIVPNSAAWVTPGASDVQ